MIVVDTSALMAIVLREPEADACKEVLEAQDNVLISAGALAEALVVSGRRGLREEISTMVERLAFEVVEVTAASAKRVSDAYDAWGRGAGTAGLNFGDCFAYELAKSRGCPLLYVGGDFSKTDVERAA